MGDGFLYLNGDLPGDFCLNGDFYLVMGDVYYLIGEIFCLNGET